MAQAIPLLMIGSAAASVIGVVRQGQAARADAAFNVAQSEQQAGISRSEALAHSLQVQRENVLRLGSMRANAAASGGTADSFSDVIADAASQGELERQWTIYQGEQRASGYESTARLDLMRGERAWDAATIKAGTELIGGASDIYGSFARLKRG